MVIQAEVDLAPPLLTPRAAATQLGISVKQLGELTDDGAIPFVNVGRGKVRPARRYEPRDIEAFREARRKIECRSTSGRAQKPIHTTSGFKKLDFQAIRERLRSERQKPS